MEHALQVEYRPLDDLTPYARNARTHSPEQVAQIAGSIREFGFTNPILCDEQGTIIAGHGRLAAAQKLGLEKVPCITIAGLTDTQRRALILADNRIAETAGWDAEMLRVELEELTEAGQDLDLIGFDEESLDELIGGLDEPHTEGDTEPEEPPATPVSRRGDVWQLGKHRLMCGDSTCAEDVARLMGGERAEICFTSPPYNTGDVELSNGDIFKNKAKKAYIGGNDKKTSADYIKFAQAALALCFKHTKEFIFWNVSYNAFSRHEHITQIIPFLPKLVEHIAWKKTAAIPLRGAMRRAWEPIYLFSAGGKGLPVGEVQSNVWEVSNTNAQHELHKACFPVELPMKAMDAAQAQSVLDPFCGTGTTIIAAENTGRRAYGMELAPAYVDVSIKRWQQHTGQQATLDGRTFDEVAQERAQ